MDHVEQNVALKDSMQQLLNAHVHLLTPYDVRQVDEKMKAFENQIVESRNAKLKKTKFSFSSRRTTPQAQTTSTNTNTSNHSNTASSVSVVGGAGVNSGLAVPDRAKAFSNVKNDKLTITPGSSNDQTQILPDDDIVISECENATIHFLCIIGAAYLKDLRNCTVYLGPVKSSIFIQNCRDCVFALASKQIRIHTSENCDFYVYARSNPIIEHCRNVRFGAYHLEYDGVREQFTMANFDYTVNSMWNDVKDFNWLGATKSPNWSIIENSAPVKL